MTTTPPVPTSVRLRLSVMMFLQFFIWGAWFVTLGTYLLSTREFTGTETAQAYSAMPWGTIVAPFVVGLIVDRFFAAEKVLAVLHFVGAGLLYYASTLHDPSTLFWALLAYACCYSPTLALVNTVSFHQLTDTKTQFPPIRVFGTLGWIAAGWIVGVMGLEAQATPLRIAAGCSVLLGGFSFLLPHTPPRAAGHKVAVSDVLGLPALALLKNRSFAVFVFSSLLLCIPLAFYYNFTNAFLNEQGVVNAAGKMTIGQMSEVAFMLIMPLCFARLGLKWMLLVGMAAWAARYGMFAAGASSQTFMLFYIGIALHGICYDFFFVTGQIYVDQAAPPETRASAQGFITLITYGVGMLIGTWLSGLVVDHHSTTLADVVTRDWTAIWMWPAGMATAVIVIFALAFKEPKATPPA
ncbi:nucleoside permease [Synoicihabitans lomoniglobus]|uniref:Nucleoside permease n=1 Tax=Synoicihabitans lomoniglobus TaxID=2909285 RepID=A0AAF0A0T8_9BACT|nr:nucleoside permease [Opitutaceae bacterium LMO-M01]WED64477.1 nucleoside permease [Opitutaceae bacterium LMO-M01]